MHAAHEGHAMPGDPASQFLMQQGSGTASNPASAAMHHTMNRYGDWMLMWHGAAFLNQVVQSGPRGGDKFFSSNWFMGMAQRPLGACSAEPLPTGDTPAGALDNRRRRPCRPGQLLVRSMLSLEPVTVSRRGYPELFQTGETAYGRPLVDAQHPHNFFMELAAEFAVSLGNDTVGYVYAAPVGDPALGPVAFPHRASALEIPQATLSHHWQDSTHIASNVITAGAKRGRFGIAVSAFHGAEPGENRWKIGSGAIDSWSIRGTWDPTPNWTAQISTGHLEEPEALERGDIQRTTASIGYHTPLPGGEVAASVIFGRNDKRTHDTISYTAEATWKFLESNYVTGRAEIVDKDELFAGLRDGHEEIFRVRSLTVGYTKDLYRARGVLGGVGGNVTLYDFPSELERDYGSSPVSYYAFVRVRLGG